jgi:hypothetical protein
MRSLDDVLTRQGNGAREHVEQPGLLPAGSIEARMAGMPRTARVVTWNGKDVPAELRELPAGRYVVEAIDDDAPALSPDEEAGIEAALESYRQGRIVDARRARQIIDAALGH